MNKTTPKSSDPGSLSINLGGAGRSSGDSAEGIASSIHQDDGVLRWLLEAWILSGVDHQTVATKVGVDSEVVEAFETRFLDLRDLRSAGDFVTVKIAQLQSDDRPAYVGFIQQAAFFGGPCVLEGFLDALGGPQGLSGQVLPKFDLNTTHGRTRALAQVAIALGVLSFEQLNAKASLQLLRWKLSRDHNRADNGSYAELSEAIAKVLPGKCRPKTIANLLRELLASQPGAKPQRRVPRK
ncbi:MAG: hypothetical protein RIC12_00730 [Pirellulales bacterium]